MRYFIILMTILFKLSIQATDDDLYAIYIFQNEICSYNGNPSIVKVTKEEEVSYEIQCTCKEQYTNDTKIRTINGNKVYCSYERRRRLITLTLSIFAPFGMDYLYLGYIIQPIVIIVVFLLIIIMNCRFFCKKEEQERENSDNGIIEVKADKNEVICKWIHLSLILLYLVFYLINIALMGFGVIPDANGFDMYNDLFFF